MLLLFCITASAQLPPAVSTKEKAARLPDGTLQSEAILKADHETTIKDVAEMMKLTEELKIELEKNNRHVVSVSSVKKCEEIEKLAKRIRSRLTRH